MAWNIDLDDGRRLGSQVPQDCADCFWVPEAAANQWEVRPELKAFVEAHLLQGDLRNVRSQLQKSS